ncbi:hypothetical protein CLOM621_06223 [Clostridium sp. M62/1]|nr:hypothetical protein CLOM621_06223 [Clostridium sp. M62/1]
MVCAFCFGKETLRREFDCPACLWQLETARRGAANGKAGLCKKFVKNVKTDKCLC